MTEYTALFTEKYLNDRLQLQSFEIPNFNEKVKVLAGWIKENRDKTIYNKKEEQLQADFLNDIFGKVLGYAYERGLDEYNLEKEEKSKTDGTKPDGVLGYLTNSSKDIRVVIELKDAYTDLDHKQNRKNDNRTPVEQAFSYVAKSGGQCKWVIVSNFREIRVYPSNDSSLYQRFMVVDLEKEEVLKQFYALLAKDKLFLRKDESSTDKLLSIKIEQDTNISNKFYAEYKKYRNVLFNHIKENNPDIDENIILTKSQKILDRIIFICFCEDIGLLPYKVFKIILDETKNARFDRRDNKLWERVKAVFDAIDKGYPEEHINQFNGGLFKPDEVIDNFVIRDAVLEDIISIEKYDFSSDLNVNILGHIFEQSISDLEEIKASIQGIETDKKKGKRKKDGIFYTPEYITKYIVNEAIGGWLEDKRKELGFYELPKIDDDEWIRIRTGKIKKNNQKVKKHLEFWLKFRDALNNIKVLDPACGSGSFLVQVFDYLKQQRKQVNDEIATFEGQQASLFNQDHHILSHNIYGVDLNAESVEITKLALWLKTANKNDKLTSLDNNIKCGNSLIDDKTIDEKAFNWNEEFKEIMDNGGFDVIVGNPPYVDSETMTKYQYDERNYIAQKYMTAKGNWDLYIPFYEKGLLLLKNKSYLMFITPNKCLSMGYGKAFRQYTIDYLYKIVDVSSFNIFDGVGISPIIIGFKKSKEHKILTVEKYVNGMSLSFSNVFDIQNYKKDNWGEYIVKNTKLINKINNHNKLKDFASVESPFTTAETYELVDIMEDENERENNNYFRFVNTGTIDSHCILWGHQYTRYLKKDYLHPVISKQKFKSLMPRRYNQQNTNKIIISGIRYFESIYDKNGEYIAGKSTVIVKDFNEKVSPEYIVSLLNSKLIKWYMKEVYDTSGMGGGINYSPNNVEIIPIPNNKTNFSDYSYKLSENNNKVLNMIDKFLSILKGDFVNIEINNSLKSFYTHDWNTFLVELKKQKIVLSGSQKDDWFERFSRVSAEIKDLQKTIAETDKQIDNLVYKLYGLTDDEISIVEQVY